MVILQIDWISCQIKLATTIYLLSIKVIILIKEVLQKKQKARLRAFLQFLNVIDLFTD